MTDIRVTPEMARALGFARLLAKQQEWSREHPQVGVLPTGSINRKGQLVMARVYRKQWRKLQAQIAFVKGGKAARDAIYPRREVLYGTD
jgi:hypothetical protein